MYKRDITIWNVHVHVCIQERRNVRCGSAPFTECNDVYIYNVTSDINDTIKEVKVHLRCCFLHVSYRGRHTGGGGGGGGGEGRRGGGEEGRGVSVHTTLKLFTYPPPPHPISK